MCDDGPVDTEAKRKVRRQLEYRIAEQVGFGKFENDKQQQRFVRGNTL